jgi:uncharacterized protein (DUF427 family)
MKRATSTKKNAGACHRYFFDCLPPHDTPAVKITPGQAGLPPLRVALAPGRPDSTPNPHPQKDIPMKAIWNGAVIAQSDETVVVEGNHYFPENSLNRDYVTFSNHHTMCSWKGQASYYSLLVNGEMNTDAAWYYPDPKPEADNIKGHIAFWKGVKIEP